MIWRAYCHIGIVILIHGLRESEAHLSHTGACSAINLFYKGKMSPDYKPSDDAGRNGII